MIAGKAWPLRLRLLFMWVSGACAVLFLAALPTGMFLVWGHEDAVRGERTSAAQTAARNHFWQMLAGTRPLDSSPEGRLASDLRAAYAQEAAQHGVPAAVSRQLADNQFYAPLNRYGDINSTLGMPAVNYYVSEGSRDITTLFEGHLNGAFKFDTTIAYPAYVRFLISPVPYVQPEGDILVWQRLPLVALLLVPVPLFWLVASPAARVRARREAARARAQKRREIASWPAPAREVHLIVTALKQMIAEGHNDPQTRTLLRHATAELKWQFTAARQEEAASRLADLERSLAENHTLGETYKETLRGLR